MLNVKTSVKIIMLIYIDMIIHFLHYVLECLNWIKYVSNVLNIMLTHNDNFLFP